MELNTREKTLGRLLFVGTPLLSVFILDSNVSDPVNTPKLFILGILSMGILSSICYSFSLSELKQMKAPILLILAFVLIGSITLVTSSSPITQSLYGVYGRNNGLLTYCFFAVTLLGGLFISSQATYLKLVYGLLLAGLINIVYCGWVLIFGDFLSWNNPYGNILGTFGNPNFIGAFLGIFFSAWLALLMDKNSSKRWRIASLFVLPVTAIEIYLSHAIQGRVLMAAGSAIVFFFWIKTRFKWNWITWIYSLCSLTFAGFAVAGALQTGPLTQYIYKTSVSLRGQYWLAAWNTGKEKPYTGVGFDGLGDWYRRMRDAHALELPGVDTVINTAHNVYLDVFAFGGWPLLASYCGLVLVTSIQVFKYSLKLEQYDPIFVAITVAWFCYQLQSMISINQIGLGVWGWVLSGSLYSYTKLKKTSDSETFSRKTKTKSNERVVGIGLVVGISMGIGAFISIPPLSADMKWMSAQLSQDAAQLELALQPNYFNPPNNQKYFMAVQIFELSNLFELSHKYALEAVKFNPDAFDSWRLLSVIKNSTSEERYTALQNMKRLDPLNPNLKGK